MTSEVQHLKYLGSYISVGSDIGKEISTRIGLAAQAFSRLRNVWKSSALKTAAKLKSYNSNVRSFLLCELETWRINKKIERRLKGFEGRCLRRILNSAGNSESSTKKSADSQASYRKYSKGVGDVCATSYALIRPENRMTALR